MAHCRVDDDAADATVGCRAAWEQRAGLLIVVIVNTFLIT